MDQACIDDAFRRKKSRGSGDFHHVVVIEWGVVWMLRITDDLLARADQFDTRTSLTRNN